MSVKVTEKKFSQFVWIDFFQPEKSELLDIAEQHGLNYFLIKDSLEIGHLPKIEKYPDYQFLILRAYTASSADRVTNVSELSNKIAFFYNSKKIITIHRSGYPFLDEVPENLKTTDDLLIFILQKMVQTFVEPSQVLSADVDDFEQKIFLHPYQKISLEDLYYQKTESRIARKLLQITQNVVSQIEVNDDCKPALQDIKDRIMSLILVFDEVTEDSMNLLNTYLSVNAQKSNDVMKLLTIFSAFFLPLTFIAGIYGMNFENMPELKWHFGYFFCLGVMLIVVVVIWVWFKRKRII